MLASAWQTESHTRLNAVPLEIHVYASRFLLNSLTCLLGSIQAGLVFFAILHLGVKMTMPRARWRAMSHKYEMSPGLGRGALDNGSLYERGA